MAGASRALAGGVRSKGMSEQPILDIDALRRAPLRNDPFQYVIVPGFIGDAALGGINADFPDIREPGSLPVTELRAGPAFRALLDALDDSDFENAMSEKFGIDLSVFPTMFTVRGRCRAGDGKIHTDSKTKIITVLLYLNSEWEAPGGRLRILRGTADEPPGLEDVADEVPPNAGTLLAFRRSEVSWHGHEPFEGPRRAIQMNWVTSARVVAHEQRRHRFSAAVKRLNPFA